MKYRYLLFDADDTLFDFPRASLEAFASMCQSNNIPYTSENYQLYYNINHALWAAFDRGEVTKEFVTLERYIRFLKALQLNRDPVQCNHTYLTALSEGVFPLPHAEEVCRALVQRGHQLYIVTNGVASVQKNRLKLCSFGHLFQRLFISEEAGASKPDKAYFDHVRAHLPELTAENALVIGDSLATDIRGANNAGLPCCWFNPKRAAAPKDLRIDHEIRDLRELLNIV
jgi:YjjG family noncanonical pyrimidine nucleotidase